MLPFVTVAIGALPAQATEPNLPVVPGVTEIGTAANGRVYMRGHRLDPPFIFRLEDGQGITVNGVPLAVRPTDPRISVVDSVTAKRHQIEASAALLARQLKIEGSAEEQQRRALEAFYLQSGEVDSVRFSAAGRVVYWTGSPYPESVIVGPGDRTQPHDPNAHMIEYARSLLWALDFGCAMLVFDPEIVLVPRLAELDDELRRIDNADTTQPFRILKLRHRNIMKNRGGR